MRLSTKSQYGLKACYILSLNFGKLMSASAFEKEMSVSAKYIEKIMRMLTKRQIIVAERGVNGGYRLAKSPSAITVGDIVRALEDDMEIIGCVSSSCCKCPSGSVWRRLYNGINKVLDEITLQSMVDDFNEASVCMSTADCECGGGTTSCSCNEK